jgi:hypothetical protein
MNSLRSYACSICGEEKTGQPGWFLLIEDMWLDRLKILHWNDRLARQEGTHCVCSPKHVQELVAHWMVTGSLSYPFASTSEVGRERECAPAGSKETDPACPGDWSGNLIGELAVHRESLERVLEENPYSLSTILEALLEAMQPRSIAIDRPKGKEENEFVTI